MDNLTEKFRRVMLRSFTKVYIKASLIKQYYTVFPYLIRLALDNSNQNKNIIIQIFKEEIKFKYFPSIQSYLDQILTIDEQEQLLNESIQDILFILNGVDSLNHSAFDDLLEGMHISDIEESINPDALLNIDKYQKNTFYLELFGRTFINSQYQYYSLSSLAPIASYYLQNQNIVQMEYGIRLMYLPNITLSSEQNNKLKNDNNVKVQRVNYIRGRFDTNEEKQIFYPLKTAEILLPTSLTEATQLEQIKQSIIKLLKNLLIQTSDFKKVFQYIFPIHIFETLIMYHLLEEQKLLTKVYEKNNVYSVSYEQNQNSDFHKGLITMIQSLGNAENPEKL